MSEEWRRYATDGKPNFSPVLGAFLIPYVIMMGLLGLPLFLIELGIGQRLRTGPIGVWNAIHPYLGGRFWAFPLTRDINRG